MKKFILPFALLSVFLAACTGGGGEAYDDYEYDAPESEATVYPMMTGTSVAVDCASDQWTCYSQYGDAMIEPSGDPYMGMIQVLEMFDMANTLDSQVIAYQSQEGWLGSELVDEYDFAGGEVGVLVSEENGKTKWILTKDLDGKTDYRVKCEATVDTDQYESYKASIETICETMRAE